MFYSVQLSKEFHDKIVWFSCFTEFMLFLKILGIDVKQQSSMWNEQINRGKFYAQKIYTIQPMENCPKLKAEQIGIETGFDTTCKHNINKVLLN
jgi:hypothetical protein